MLFLSFITKCLSQGAGRAVIFLNVLSLQGLEFIRFFCIIFLHSTLLEHIILTNVSAHSNQTWHSHESSSGVH